jgi:hypothetical protein
LSSIRGGDLISSASRPTNRPISAISHPISRVDNQLHCCFAGPALLGCKWIGDDPLGLPIYSQATLPNGSKHAPTMSLRACSAAACPPQLTFAAPPPLPSSLVRPQTLSVPAFRPHTALLTLLLYGPPPLAHLLLLRLPAPRPQPWPS